MNLDELQSVQARERQSDGLQELRPSFYRDAAEFVADLRAERARVAAEADEPFEDPTVTRLSDDIRTAEGTVEAIYERRVGKVVKLASLSAANMPADDAGLTTEEQELYETLTDAIEGHREEVLATLGGDAEGDSSTPESDRTATEAESVATPEESVDPADLMGSGADAEPDRPDGGADGPATDIPATDVPDTDGVSADASDIGESEESESETSGSERIGSDASTTGRDVDESPSAGNESAGQSTAGEEEAGDERTTVRITRDVGAILGVDEREYDLATDDVVTLPAANAEPLIERDAAERLE